MKRFKTQEAVPQSCPAKVLVVDDDAANLVALQEVLGELGQPIVCVRSGEEALRRLLEDDFAIILLDVRMPDMDGYETAALIRSRERSRRVPIIFLSAVDKEKSHLFRGYAAGAVDYVFKPIEPVLLRAKVAVFLDLHLKAQEIRQKAEQEKRLLEENLRVRAQQWETAEALKRSLAQQALVIDALPILLYVAAAKERGERRFIGGHLDTLIHDPKSSDGAVPWLDRVHPDDVPRLLEAFENLIPDQPRSAEYRIKCANGEFRWFSDYMTLNRGDEQEHFGILLDITNRRLLEQQLAHAQKIEAIGEMTGSIAHDFNNMLTVIMGGINRALASEIADDTARKRLDLAKQAAGSCADLTKRLLGFARRQVLEPKRIDLAEELPKLRELIERLAGDAITINTKIEKTALAIFIDGSQLESAIINLIVNARDAMPEGGQVLITATNRPRSDPRLSQLGLQPGDYVELAISDSGSGIPPDVKARVFEPFFTTKASGKGTGLGLSIIHEFARQSGGTATIDSVVGEGTTVALYLPKAPGAKPFKSVDRGRQIRRNGLEGCHVLLVEDEDKARELAKGLLEDMGCSVSVAESGDVAMGLLKNEPSISLLFTDCNMPGDLDGPQLAMEVRRRLPGLPVLFTSGVRGRVDSVGNDTQSVAFLSKPYTSSELNSAISELLWAPLS